MKLKIVGMIILMIGLTTNVSSNSLIVENGLLITPPKTLDLTYQTIPSYDETQKLLVGWEGENLQYFISFSKLPPGWLEADVWFAGLKRDLKAASNSNEITIIKEGNFKSIGKLNGSYIEYQYTLKGEETPIHQVANFLSDNSSSYIAFATLSSNNASKNMLSDTISVLKTADISSSSFSTQVRNEDKYVGNWSGSTKLPDGRIIITNFELKNDLSFSGKISIGTKLLMENSGVWSVGGNTFTWDYLYSNPPLPAGSETDFDTIKSFDGDNMLLVSKKTGRESLYKRIK